MRDQLEHVIRRHSGNSRSIGNCSDVRDDIHCFKAFAYGGRDAIRVGFVDEVATIDEE